MPYGCGIQTVAAMKLAEWAELPEDEPGEFAEGELLEEEVADFAHELAVVWATRAIDTWIAPRGGLVGGSEVKLATAEEHGRKPDVCVFFAGRRPPRRGLVTLPPDIAVEVLSPSPKDVRRDRIDKLNEYAEFGVRFYWIVDPDARTLEIFELTPDKHYTLVVNATGGVVRQVPGCEGLELDLDALWARLDLLGPPGPASPADPAND
jgi:Uma2 family endonuclease